MRYVLLGCSLCFVMIIGCAKKEEAPTKGTVVPSKEIETKGKGKLVADEAPPPVK
jgi:hypothetical protein